MRKCSNCGQAIPKAERYCPHCGYMRHVPTSLDSYALGFVENFKNCIIHKYADFDGRASRSEYWYFMLGYQFIVAVILFICALLSYVTPLSGTLGVSLGLIVLLILSLGLIIPGMAVAVRRLHDLGWTGWLVLVAFIPFVGIPGLLIVLALPGQHDENRFGTPTGTRNLTKQMAHEFGLIDSTPSTGMTMGLVVFLIILWVLVDRMLMVDM